jgi:hypothetical protein
MQPAGQPVGKFSANAPPTGCKEEKGNCLKIRVKKEIRGQKLVTKVANMKRWRSVDFPLFDFEHQSPPDIYASLADAC